MNDGIRMPPKDRSLGFAQPGGHTYAHRCGVCSNLIPNLGRRKVKHRGVFVMAGKCCQKEKT